MIGSQEEECKETRVVFFSNCSPSMDGFLDTAELHTLLHSIEVEQVKTRTLHKPPFVPQGKECSALNDGYRSY
jgi:hypothetical protein